jgi:hypothetical protein
MDIEVQTNDALKDQSQLLVEAFMRTMSGRQEVQSVPTRPTVRNDAVCCLRARLMIEETVETIDLGLGLGISIEWLEAVIDKAKMAGKKTLGKNELSEPKFERERPVNMVELAGNLADVDVVGPRGTAAAFGIAHWPIMMLVSGNNLLKFAPGHTYRDDGKLVKPKTHPAPEQSIKNLLFSQGMKYEQM